jgi:hypothetical protein
MPTPGPAAPSATETKTISRDPATPVGDAPEPH